MSGAGVKPSAPVNVADSYGRFSGDVPRGRGLRAVRDRKVSGCRANLHAGNAGRWPQENRADVRLCRVQGWSGDALISRPECAAAGAITDELWRPKRRNPFYGEAAHR